MDERLRLYKIDYEAEDGETYEAVIPEWMLPEFENINDIEIIGRLHEELDVVRVVDPEEPEKEPIPIRSSNG